MGEETRLTAGRNFVQPSSAKDESKYYCGRLWPNPLFLLRVFILLDKLIHSKLHY